MRGATPSIAPGLAGVYSIDLRWSPDNTRRPAGGCAARDLHRDPGAAGAAAQAGTAPTDVLVIDSAERPEEN